MCCGADEAEVERRAANIGRKRRRAAGHGVAGTPDEVVARLQAFADIGAQTIYLQVLDLDDLEHIELLAEGSAAAGLLIRFWSHSSAQFGSTPRG